jgi:hypothetical protein
MSEADAHAGKLGALRWTLVQRTGDALANLILIVMGAAGNSSWECYLSVRKISRAVQCHPRTTQRKIEYLLLRGYIQDISSQSESFIRRTRTYRLGFFE